MNNSEKGESTDCCPQEATPAPQQEPSTRDPGPGEPAEEEYEEGDMVSQGSPSTRPHPGAIEAPDGGWGCVMC